LKTVQARRQKSFAARVIVPEGVERLGGELSAPRDL